MAFDYVILCLDLSHLTVCHDHILIFLSSAVQEQYYSVPSDYHVAVEVFGSAGCEKTFNKKEFL